MEMYIAIAVVLIVVVALLVVVLSKKKAALPTPKVEEKQQAKESTAAPVQPVETVSPWNQKLEKTRTSVVEKLGGFFSSEKKEVLPQEWDQIEEALLEGDVGFPATSFLMNKVKTEMQQDKQKSFYATMAHVAEDIFKSVDYGEIKLEGKPKPYVISIVGINGVGKTTTIGKLASHFSSRGKSVLLGAADTFRAGAIDQLKVWAERTNSQFVTGREGADPGAVSFDSVTAGKARGIDIVLLDTAGRLHTKSNLMDELKKIDRVIKKVIPEAPHETWLVIDGTLGQNSIQQAKEFQKTLPLTGVIVTKLDGTAKGGALLSIVTELKVPIRYIGLGEKVEDLVAFEPKPFVEAILGPAPH